jgi:hypothetical protein
MSGFFTRERFGTPQFTAALLLLIFLGQCIWLASRAVLSPDSDPAELRRIHEGVKQWHGAGIAGRSTNDVPGISSDEDARAFPEPIPRGYDAYRSPMYYLICSAPLLVWPGSLQNETASYWRWLARAPSILLGLLLGASLWYVSHRLYGNPGGYIALTLYCFAPGIIRSSAVWYVPPEMAAAWGTFGAIFTAIAVSHTLYAPREVVLWNWRRIVLLGISLALAVGTQFSLIILMPVVLGFLLYLAPTRRPAAWAIWAAALGLAAFLLFAAYFFHAQAFWEDMRRARFFSYTGQAFTMAGAYRQLLAQLVQLCPALAFAVPIALVAYCASRRMRYFGNTAPLLVAILFVFLGFASPHFPGLGFRLLVLPFLFLFVAGVIADLLETRQRALVSAGAWGLLAAYALWSLLQLARVGVT